ncbi:hypothetical protein [Rhizobacter sp. Root1221]|uniref:hypothetical protein n=1 Tax=Rhizobacter sp. Root1221 TaxID=1736433 RepID=UPI0006F5595C|nr:hypothetical protein [Rhizobacter sp. Root1221]KQW02331.1 hypothetical protein ASC87_14015 [Rhizobacter sp. Root1221]
MKVRFRIDRLIVDGANLSSIERARLKDALRMSLEAQLLERMETNVSLPRGELHFERRHIAMPMAVDVRGAALGMTLGPVVAQSVWPTAPQS